VILAAQEVEIIWAISSGKIVLETLWRRDSSPGKQGKGLRCTMEPHEAQEPAMGVLPARLVRTRV
jgi:hypothetical protein